MPKKKTTSRPSSTTPKSMDALTCAVAKLRARATKSTRDGLARYGIATKDEVLGVTMAHVNVVAKKIGTDHRLALALWDTGCYEARMLATMVDEVDCVTPAQMERWVADFDNWATCDTACFKLFDRTPHAWDKISTWCRRTREFEKRAGFALLASVALHDKVTGDELFLAALETIEAASTDERNFVKKAVSWALRTIGSRGTKLNAAAVRLSERMSTSPNPTTRWIGKDAFKDLTSPTMQRRVAARERKKDATKPVRRAKPSKRPKSGSTPSATRAPQRRQRQRK